MTHRLSTNEIRRIRQHAVAGGTVTRDQVRALAQECLDRRTEARARIRELDDQARGASAPNDVTREHYADRLADLGATGQQVKQWAVDQGLLRRTPTGRMPSGRVSDDVLDQYAEHAGKETP